MYFLLRSPSCVINDLVSQLSRQIINFSMVYTQCFGLVS